MRCWHVVGYINLTKLENDSAIGLMRNGIGGRGTELQIVP